MKKTKKDAQFQSEQLLLIIVIAAFTSALWRFILGVPPFEELWWAHFAPVGVLRPSSYQLPITAASCVTWGLLAPFLYRGKAWSVLPVAVVSPFLWALLVNAGWFCVAGFGHIGFSRPLVGLFMQGLAFFAAWVLSAQAARVFFPIAFLAAALIWLSLNKLDLDKLLNQAPAK